MKFKHLLFLIVTLFISNLIIAQKSADEVLQELTQHEQEVNTAIIKNELHHHVINLNTNKKKWLGIENYSEVINCYFDLTDDGIYIKKILVITTIGAEEAYKNYLFGENGEIELCYTDFEGTGAGDQPQKSAFFYNKELLAFSSSDKMMLDNDLSDEMVSMASGMYKEGLKYKKFFQGLLLIQVNNE